MRLRKKVLLWGEREIEAATMAFVLDNQAHFKVTTADSDQRFEDLLREGPWDLVIVPHLASPHHTSDRVERTTLLAQCRVLVLSWHKDHIAPRDTQADMVLPYYASAAEIIERARILAARKRGHRKGTRRAVPQPPEEVACAR